MFITFVAPDYSTDPRNVIDGIAKHDKMHRLFALGVVFSQVLFYDSLRNVRILHLFVYLTTTTDPDSGK